MQQEEIYPVTLKNCPVVASLTATASSFVVSFPLLVFPIRMAVVSKTSK